jgi:hypothetical protein
MYEEICVFFHNVADPIVIHCKQEDKSGIMQSLFDAIGKGSLFTITGSTGISFIIRTPDVRAVY